MPATRSSGSSAMGSLYRIRAELAAMALGAAALAIVGVGADKHVPAVIIEHDLIEINAFGAAERAGLGELLHLERMVLEVEAHDLGVGRHCVDALLAAGAEELQRLAH